MAIRDIFKFSRKTFVNPSGWMDYEFLKGQTTNIYSVLRGLFTSTQPELEETFEQALERMHLNEADADSVRHSYRRYALFFLLIAMGCFVYSFYLLFAYHAIFEWILGLAITGLFLAKAFQFDFWAYQIKRRKLGATFNEWFDALFGGKGGSA